MPNLHPELLRAGAFYFCGGLQARLVRVIRRIGLAATFSFPEIITTFIKSAKTFFVWAGTQSEWVGPMLSIVSAYALLGPGLNIFGKSPTWEVGL